MIAVPQNKLWENMLTQFYGKKAKIISRYATKKEPPIFNKHHLEKIVASLPKQYTLSMIDSHFYKLCKSEAWSKDLVSQFSTYEKYRRLGIGVVISKDGLIISGASSYSRYKNFGTCAAKLDDLVNYIPARLSAWFMVAAAAVEGHHWKDAIRIYRRDRRNHASPNSAQTEAVMAGALGVQLAGNAWYFGKLYEKPTIGDDKRKIEAEDIRRANQMLYGTAVIAVLAFTMLYIGICL